MEDKKSYREFVSYTHTSDIISFHFSLMIVSLLQHLISLFGWHYDRASFLLHIAWFYGIRNLIWLKSRVFETDCFSNRMLILIVSRIRCLYPQLDKIRKIVAEMAGVAVDVVRIVVSPYRICPLGAHIDHQVATYLHLSSCFIYIFEYYVFMASLYQSIRI